MEGFFNRKETQSKSAPQGKVLSCASCGLYLKGENPRREPSGGFDKKILIISDIPSERDDRRGKYWQDDWGVYLKECFSELGVDVDRDCLSTYALRCYSDKPNENPVSCRKEVVKAIDQYKPHLIILLGDLPLISVVGNRWEKQLDTITKWRGFVIPDQLYKAWVAPVFHPKYVYDESKKYPEIELIWKQDLENALSYAYKPFVKTPNPEIIYLDSPLDLPEIKENSTIVIDYETTGLKPHAPGHRIVCASLAVSPTLVYVFLMPTNRAERKTFTDILKNKNIHKGAHNLKFEEHWSRVRLGYNVESWEWDSMIAAHILDNRRGITGLKFQTYVELGVGDYDSVISSFLKADDSNGVNSIYKLLEKPNGEKQLLKYCALDSAYTYAISEKQKKIIFDSPDLLRAYQLFHDGSLALARAEHHGFRVDLDYLDNTIIEVEKTIEEKEEAIKKTKFYSGWKKALRTTPNMDSNKQLSDYLYNTLGIEPEKTTKSGKGSTDEEALKALDLPELNVILEVRKLKKSVSTYLEAYKREQVKGVIHPSFGLNGVISYRGSCSNPNFQNVPKRDPETMRLVRRGMFPRKGGQLMEVDFSGLEVCIAACYHQDPVMIDYLLHDKDLHGDMAKEIFFFDTFDKHAPNSKEFRFAAKSAFVFAQFYGDYYQNNAIGLCKLVELPVMGKFKMNTGIKTPSGVPLANHFIYHKIETFDDFVAHLKKIENHFWNERFMEYGKWKKRRAKQYQKKGYFDNYTGFRFTGLMRKNEVTNYPVQSSAFHCLLWCFIKLDEYIMQNNFETRIIGQIHDALVIDIHPPELKLISKKVYELTTIDLADTWKWINIPLHVEAELAGVDESWADVKEYKLI